MGHGRSFAANIRLRLARKAPAASSPAAKAPAGDGEMAPAAEATRRAAFCLWRGLQASTLGILKLHLLGWFKV